MPNNPLHAIHEQAEAAFLPYGTGIEVVESYGEVEAEYAAIRKGAALMDDPHRVVVILTGKDRLSFLQNKLTNEVAKLQPGQGCYAYFLNVKGRIQLDMSVLHSEDATLIEIDARLAAGFAQQLERFHFGEDIKILDASEQLARVTLIGPRAAALLTKICDGGFESLAAPFAHGRKTIAGAAVTLFRNDLCGQEQYELILPRDELVRLWQILQDAGNDTPDGPGSLRAIGWSAFNTARIEAGSPLLGIDITDGQLPMETGPWYARAVAVTKGCYLGQEVVARMHAHNTVARMLAGLRVSGERLPVAGTPIFDGTTQIGMVSSSCFSPMLGNVPIAMGMVKRAYATPGRVVEVLAEGARAKAAATELPFWKPPVQA